MTLNRETTDDLNHGTTDDLNYGTTDDINHGTTAEQIVVTNHVDWIPGNDHDQRHGRINERKGAMLQLPSHDALRVHVR